MATATAPSPMLDTALDLARRGLYVFPLEPRDKRPARFLEHGKDHATTDAATISSWFATDHNIGIACAPSRWLVLDADVPKAKNGYTDGRKRLAELELELGPLPIGPFSDTGSEGHHRPFRAPEVKLVGKIGRAIDVIANGYIVAPPSVHESGRRYRWRDGLSLDDVEIPELPALWLDYLRAPEPEQAPTERASVSTSTDDDFYRALASLSQKRVLECISGTRLVNGERFTFKATKRGGKCNLYVDYGTGYQPTSNFIASDGTIGARATGGKSDSGPYASTWLRYYGHDDRQIRAGLIEHVSELAAWEAARIERLKAARKRSTRTPDERDLHDDEGPMSDEDPREPPSDEIGARRKRTRKPKPPIGDDLGASDHAGRGPRGGYRLTPLGNACRFADLHRDRLRYVPAWGKWLAWDGRRWHRDDLDVEQSAAKQVIAQLYADAAASAMRAAGAVTSGGTSTDESARDGGIAEALADWATKSSYPAGVDGTIKLARSEPGIVASADVWDRDPWALNVANGTIDLRDGELRPHRQSDLITKLAPTIYDPEARAPEWERFLVRVLPDADVRTWVQRYLGYALTGDVREQCLGFFVGAGANGKNVLLDVVIGALGEYGWQAAPDLVLASYGDRHPTELAELEGKRLVACSEIDQGRAWNEARIKSITGDATITARKMREDFHSFPATHKIVVAANTKPIVRGTDDGIWRRMRIVPWDVQIPPAERDKTLAARLIATEASGILSWLVRGCLAWQRAGLGTANAIESATSSYRADQDTLGRWIEDRCTLAADAWQAVASLYASYTMWCETEGTEPWSQRAWRGRLLEGRGIGEGRRERNTIRVLTGIATRTGAGDMA